MVFPSMKAVLSSLVVQETGSRGCCTFPSPSASVDVVRFVRFSGRLGGVCCTFPEPEAEGEIKISLQAEETSSSHGKYCELWADADENAQPSIRDRSEKERRHETKFKGRRHSRSRGSAAKAARWEHIGVVHKSSRPPVQARQNINAF